MSHRTWRQFRKDPYVYKWNGYAKYIGADLRVRFCKALVRTDPRSRRHLLAQFDRSVNGDADYLCFHWHRFKRSEFKILNNGRSHAHWAKLGFEDSKRFPGF